MRRSNERKPCSARTSILKRRKELKVAAGPHASLQILQDPANEVEFAARRGAKSALSLENSQNRCTGHGAPVPPCTSILKHGDQKSKMPKTDKQGRKEAYQRSNNSDNENN